MIRGAVIISGTGVSVAASRDPATGESHPEASWAGLLRNGLAWLKDHQLISNAKAQAHLALLEPEEAPDTNDFLSAAQVVTRNMGGAESRHFSEWLKRTVGAIKAHDRRVLDVLEALRQEGHLLATTNYDDLLLDEAGLRIPVTWKETDAFIRAARNVESDKIIFLHGYWRHPDSVILDWTSYQQISRDQRYRQDLATVWQMTTWIYVGCGTSGLSDPDLGLLLERYGRRARNAELWDFCLVKNDQRAEFQAHFDRFGANICAVSFGSTHDHLPQFLGGLLSRPPASVTTADVVPFPSVPQTSVGELTERYLFVPNADLEFDQQEMVRHGVDDLDQALANAFLGSEIAIAELESLGIDHRSTLSISAKLARLGLMSNSHLLVGTFLCMAAEPELARTFSSCGLHLVSYDGIERGIVRASTNPFNANLITLFSKGMQWLRNQSGLHRRGEVGDANRDDLEIPSAVLRESLANALIHRNYQDKSHRQQPTRIEVYSNRVEITSFGHLPRGLTVDALNDPQANVRPIRVNPTIARIMLRVKHAELNAIGVPRMRMLMDKAGLPLPRYVYNEPQGILTVVLSRPSPQSESRVITEAAVGPRSSDFQGNQLTQLKRLPPGNLSAMISSSTIDLPEHREAAVEACLSQGLFPILTEHLPARDTTAIEASLKMVETADVFIGIYGWRYGWIPDFNNVERISIVEMEFNRALECKAKGRLKEILIFIMDSAHPVRLSHIEADEEAQSKLYEFKRRVSQGRIAALFKSQEELKGQIIRALSDFQERIVLEPKAFINNDRSSVPKPPAFYAEPEYVGSHEFVGRDAELQTLSDWAANADPTPLLLLEGIGGNGKSMLTWQWTTKHSTEVRTETAAFAGRFWYSFYGKGAGMADFCRHGLAYMTERPLQDFAKKKIAELTKDLVAQLRARPWLLILDGLERVLVAYHRIDASEVPDEEANSATDKIANRNPRDAVRVEDNDLLRALAAAAPSKILATSRLTPRVLLNPSGQPIIGAKRITLPGLRPSDAETLLRSFGIDGESSAIQRYLTANCDNHPLVIGVLGGLVNNYLPARQNFDAWVVDPDGGAKLDLASLDLTQRRNHILRAALEALPPSSHQLLSTLALLSESVDYETLKALNPHLPAEPNEVKKPMPPEDDWDWNDLSANEKAERQKRYEAVLAHRKDYKTAVRARLASEEFREASKRLMTTVADLEQRGLLQYDDFTRRYDLHPVVRGVAAGGMTADDKERYGQRVVDHFSQLQHSPYAQAEALEDLRPGLNVVRTLLKLGRFQQAANAYRGDLATALRVNVEAYSEALQLLIPLFPAGWEKLPKGVDDSTAAFLTSEAAIALESCGRSREALAAYGAALRVYSQAQDWKNTNIQLRNVSASLASRNLLAIALRIDILALDLAAVRGDQEDLFMSRLSVFLRQGRLGHWAEGETAWELLNLTGREWSRNVYRPGDAEWYRAQFLYWKGTVKEEDIVAAERLATEGKNRGTIRRLHRLRGAWRLEQSEWEVSAASFAEALRMARESGISDTDSETGLALAKHRLGQLAEPQREAERLAQQRKPAHRLLAQLWLALGDHEQAKPHALAAHKWAWADGEPFVNRYEVTKTTELLRQMQIPIPNLPPYDPLKDEPYPSEADVRAAIEKLLAQKEAEKPGGGAVKS